MPACGTGTLPDTVISSIETFANRQVENLVAPLSTTEYKFSGGATNKDTALMNFGNVVMNNNATIN